MKQQSQKIGAEWEKTLRSVFSSLRKTHGFAYHALVDSAAAGNTVAAQPSDFIVSTGDGIAFLEAKASVTHDKMQMGLLRPAQRAAIKVWCQMLGCKYYILFLSKDKTIHLLDGGKFMQLGARNYRYSRLFQVEEEDLEKHLAKEWKLGPTSVVVENYRRNYE